MTLGELALARVLKNAGVVVNPAVRVKIAAALDVELLAQRDRAAGGERNHCAALVANKAALMTNRTSLSELAARRALLAAKTAIEGRGT